MAKIYSQLEKAQLENTTSDTGSLPKGTVTYRTDLNQAKVSNGTVMKALAELDATNALELQEIATPATPSSGNGKIYFKSDGKLYQLNDDGTETQVGSGSGGGSINYVSNPDAESNTTGWIVFADAVASRPVDGTGGSPTKFTWTRSTSSPLRGTANFLATVSSTAQGEGVAYDFTINSADQAKVLQISFDYQIASGTYSGGTPSTDSDLIGYIYRTTATGRLIEPSVIKLDGGVVGVNYSYRGEFQADSDATGYRLILFVATAANAAFTMKFDNFAIGPSKNVAGAITTEWVSFTPTGGWNTNVTYSGKWRRVGDSMELRALVTCSGAPNAASLSFNMPSGYSIDTNKLETTGQAENLGYGTAFDTGTQQYMLYLTYGASATELRPRYINEGAGAVGNTVSNVIPFTFGNTDTVEVFAAVPIVGWGATATLGQDADTRVVSARIGTSGAPTGTIASSIGSSTTIQFNSVTHDSHGAYVAATGYTVPVAGTYDITAQQAVSHASIAVNQEATILILVNGSVVAASTVVCANASNLVYYPRTSTSRVLKAGDIVTVRITSNGTTPVTASDSTGNQLTVDRASGPSQIAASEDVSAMATTSNTTIAASGATALQFSVTEYDTHGSITLNDSGYTTFRAPIAGLYQISSHYSPSAAVTPSGIGNLAAIRLAKSTASTTSVKHLGQFVAQQSGTGIFFELNGDTNIRLVAGEKINLYIQNGLSGSTWAGVNTTTSTWFSIVKVG